MMDKDQKDLFENKVAEDKVAEDKVAEDKVAEDKVSKSSKYYIPVNRNNLYTIIASGIIIPATGYYKYDNDIQLCSSNKILLLKDGFDFSQSSSLGFDISKGALIEVDINYLDKKNIYEFTKNKITKLKSKSDSKIIFYDKAISIFDIKNIFFKNKDEQEDFEIRNVFENVPKGVIPLKSSEKIFKSKLSDDEIKKIKSLKKDNNKDITKYQYADSISGSFLIFLNFLQPTNIAFTFFKDFFQNLVKDEKSAINNNVSKRNLDQDIFNFTLDYLVCRQVEEGWEPRKLLDCLCKKVNENKKKYDRESYEQFNKWHQITLEILDNKRDIIPLTDDKFIIGRAILLIILRPNADDLKHTLNSNLEPGDLVISLASIFCGARLGTESSEVIYKQTNKEVFNFIINLKCFIFNNDLDLLASNNIQIEEKFTDNSLKSILKLKYKNDLLLERIDNGPVELNKILHLAKDRKNPLTLKADKKFNRLMYKFEFPKGREQTVYIDIGNKTIDGHKTLRFYSPCLDLSLKNNEDYYIKNCRNIHRMNNEPSQFCYFSEDKELKLLIAKRDVIDFSGIDKELDFLKHVAEKADEFEKKIGFDKY